MEETTDTKTEKEALNPYAPPLAEVVTASAGVNPLEMYQTASSGKRFLNLLLDNVGQMALGAAIGFLLAVLDESGLLSGSVLWMDEMNKLQEILFGYVVAIIYYYFFEMIFSRTPGKWITGTLVVTESGGKPPPLQILGRTLCRLVPFEALSFLGGSGSGWHDRWSGTLVLDVRNPYPSRLSQSLARHYR